MTHDTNSSFTIGIVVPYLKSRGTEKQALALAKGFLDKQAKVVLFVVQGWGLEHMYDAFSKAGVEVVNVGPAVGVNQKKIDKRRFLQLAGLARQHRCNILLSRAGMTNQLCGRAAALARIPSVVVASSAVSYRRVPNRNPLKELLATWRWRSEFGFPSHIVTVSSEGGTRLASAYPQLARRVSSINNGVDVATVLSLSKQTPLAMLPDGKFNICYTGSVELKRKGLDTLIEALGLLVNEHGQDAIFLNIVGAGEDKESVAKLAQSHGIDSHVSFLGEAKNPFAIVSQADAFVLPSRREGLPNALLEAMSLGVCAISTDCDTGPREIIEDEVNGLLVPVEDSKGLAAAVLRVKEDEGLRGRLAYNGRQTVEKSFSYQGMVNAYYNLLSQLSFTSSTK